MNERDASFCASVEVVANAVNHLQSGKSGGEEDLNSDHSINVILCQIFNL